MVHSDAKGVSVPGCDVLGSPADLRAFVEDLAAVPFDQIDLDYLWRDVVYARGSLPKETRRQAGSAIRTLRDILAAAIRRQQAAVSDSEQVGIRAADALNLLGREGEG